MNNDDFVEYLEELDNQTQLLMDEYPQRDIAFTKYILDDWPLSPVLNLSIISYCVSIIYLVFL